MVRARLSRRIALWIFLNFLVVEGMVLVPSVLRQADRLGAQLPEVTNARFGWLEATGQAGSSDALLEAVRGLQGPATVKAIEGAALYRESTGELLGGFGATPQISAAMAQRDASAGRWFALSNSYDAAPGGADLPGDLLLVIRHDAGSMRAGLRSYVLNIVLIVLGIAAFLTLITMLVVHRMVINPILTLRDRLVLAGAAFAGGNASDPVRFLLPSRRADEVGEVEKAFNHPFLRTAAEMERRVAAERLAHAERDRAGQLLLNILPAPIADQMKRGRRIIAEAHLDVSVLFADIVGFTELSARLSCHSLVNLLNQVFTAFDQLCERHGLEKIKTIGDNYMVVGGVPAPCDHHAGAIAAMALDMQSWIRGFRVPDADRLHLRIGMHCGPVALKGLGAMTTCWLEDPPALDGSAGLFP